MDKTATFLLSDMHYRKQHRSRNTSCALSCLTLHNAVSLSASLISRHYNSKVSQSRLLHFLSFYSKCIGTCFVQFEQLDSGMIFSLFSYDKLYPVPFKKRPPFYFLNNSVKN